MKKERHYLIFSKDKPENEWEAKYLTKQNQTNTWSTVAISGLLVLMVSIAILTINIHPCQAEFEGSVSGIFDFNTNNFPDSTVNELVINNGEGKIKVSGTCTAITMLANR